MRITETDHCTLASALELDYQGHGIYPEGSAQCANFKSLERRGLLVFDGLGFAVDRAPDRERPIYHLTPKGRALASVLEENFQEGLSRAARQPLLDEIRHLREQLEAADKRNGELAAENAVLRDRLEVKEDEIREYERSMENANLEIRRLREELADYKGDGYFDPELEEGDETWAW